MNLRRLTATATLVVAAMSVGAGTSYAAPAEAPTPVNYEAGLVDGKVVTTLDGGVFQVKSDSTAYDVLDNAGNVLLTLPLTYNMDGMQFPLLPELSNDDKTISLTVERDITKAVAAPLRHDVASNEENLQAYGHFSSLLGLAMAAGGLIGLAAGAALGCVAFIWFAVVGCLPGIAAGAAMGSVLGTIAAGGPTLVVAGTDLINTLTAPPNTTRYASPQN